MDESLNSEYILETTQSINNTTSLAELKNAIEESKQAAINTADYLASIESETDSSLLSLLKYNNQGLEYKEVVLEAEVATLFDPDNPFCELPKLVQKKLKERKAKGEQWAPKEIVQYLKKKPQMAAMITGSSVVNLMHRITIEGADGKTRAWTVFGAPTYENSTISDLLISEGFDTFLYMLDCSGYLNASIEGAAAFLPIKVNSSAQTALSSSKSMFLAGGVLASPLAVAYYGKTIGKIEMPLSRRIATLEALMATPGLSASDRISFPNAFEVIWFSKEGDKSFNGKADFSFSGGASMGVGQISGSAGAGTEIGRKTAFKSFNTYFTDKKPIEDLAPLSMADIEKKIEELKAL